jgi:hypothetical protein
VTDRHHRKASDTVPPSRNLPDELPGRLRALCDLRVAEVRESAGRHEYDGVVQDLSPSGVRAGVEALDDAWLAHPAPDDAFDEELQNFGGSALRGRLSTLADHRRNPIHHLENLDLAGYDRDYAPAEVRDEAKRRHVAAWPDAVDAAVESLDRVPSPTARALLPALRGLADGVTDERALAALARLVAHVEGFARSGDESPAYDGDELLLLLWSSDRIVYDLGRLAERADAERTRLRERLDEACRHLDPEARPAELVPRLLRDHPQSPEQIYAEARALIG